MNEMHVPHASDFAVKQENLEEKQSDLSHSRKRRVPFGQDTFTDNEQRAIRQKLDVGLSRNETMQRPGPGGVRITYIEGWKVIHDANQIFGFNGWSSQIVALDVRFIDEARGRFSACVSATVRITLRDGCSREDRGGGIAENMRSKGEAVLKAEKEAITDATKRALKNFGLRLGLSLYDRQHVREMNKPQPREPAKEPTRVPVTNVQTPVPARAAPTNPSRFSPKGPNASPMTPAVPTFRKVKTPNGVATPSSPENPIDAALAAKVVANREEAILRKRQQAYQRARANQTSTNTSAAAINGYHGRQGLQSGAVNAMAGGQYGTNFSSAQRAASSNAFSAGVSAAHASNLRRASANAARNANQGLPLQNPGLSVAQYSVGKQQFAMAGGSVNASTANVPQRQGPGSVPRPQSTASNRSAPPDVTVTLGIPTSVGVPQGVEAQTIPLGTSTSGGVPMKQTEIDELSAIALADF